MGRSIPSFRMLIDIEKKEWRIFKERLSKRKDKESFNKLFSIPKLFCHSLSNLSRPVIIEPILLSVLFYGFKELNEMVDKSVISSNKKKNLGVGIQNNIETSKNDIPLVAKEGIWYKDYNFAQILEDWKEFSECLSKEEEAVFVEMITCCYDSYHLSINSNNSGSKKDKNNNQDKKSNPCLSRTASLFMALFLYQQKQLELIKADQRLLDSYN